MNLSIIIPTRNRAILLSKTLESIIHQTLEQEYFEIIVIDNGSTDNTKEVVDSYKPGIKNLNYFFEKTPGLHRGRHRGLKESKTEILVYCDDDIEAFPTWLESILEVFDDKSVGLVGGKNLPAFESEPPKWLIDLWDENKRLGILSIIDEGNSVHEIEPTYVWGCNFSIRKSILLESGGFHPDAMPLELLSYRGDGEGAVSSYVKNSKYKSIYHPKASVYHLVSNYRMSEEYFCKRRFSQGISDSYYKLRKYGKFSDLNAFKLKRNQNAQSLYDKMYNSYVDGYIYHQIECKNSKELMKWVTKDNYYD